MAECRCCGAEVEIGNICAYCGRKAEPMYYPDYTLKAKKETPKEIQREKPPLIPIKIGIHYTVVSGDNLWNIAKRAYGKGFLYKHILKHNKQIKNPNLIYVGQRIYIPPYEESNPVCKEKKDVEKCYLDDDLPPMGGFHD